MQRTGSFRYLFETFFNQSMEGFKNAFWVFTAVTVVFDIRPPECEDI